MEERTHNVSRWIKDLSSDDAIIRNEAAAQIWGRFSERLLRLARNNLQPRIRTRVDEHDIVNSMYKSVCERVAHGKFEQLENRDELWHILITITLNKTREAVRRHKAKVRRVDREVSGEGDADDERLGLLIQMESSDPDPAEAVMMSDTLEQLLSMLDPKQRQVALWKLEGWTSEQIASPDKMDVAVRTVERYLAQIRTRWTAAGIRT